ncbi:MAG: endonuclease/exonuclease/phosphatase family protein [Chlamydiales bacterium]
MAVGISEESSGWDRTLLYGSSLCAEPICTVAYWAYRVVAPLDPMKFDNCQNRIVEAALRLFTVVLALAATVTVVIPLTLLALGVASKVLRAAGFALQKNGYTHVRGDLPEATLTDGRAKLMTWNVCGIGAGLHYDHGGVNHWSSRVDEISAKIIAENPDVLVLQEIYDTAFAEALIQKLKSHYAHIYFHLGPNTLGSVGGGMVLTKCAVHSFSSASFDNNSWQLNRTLACLEIKASPEALVPCARIIGTHLIDENYNKQMEQWTQIKNFFETQEQKIPTVLLGDLNLERDKPMEGGLLGVDLEHSYVGLEPTRTAKLLEQWDKNLVDSGDFIDYISRFIKDCPDAVQLKDAHLVKAYTDDYDTTTASSDHNALAATLCGL